MKRVSKLSRTKNQRLAIYRGLLEEIILHERIITTDIKAKALKRHFDRLVTRAKKGSLADFRHVYSVVYTKIAGEKLIHELTKRLDGVSSGYTRLIKLPARKGDGAKMTEISIRDFRENLVKDTPRTEKKALDKKKQSTPEAESNTPKTVETTIDAVDSKAKKTPSIKKVSSKKEGTK